MKTLLILASVVVAQLGMTGCGANSDHPTGSDHPEKIEHPAKSEHPDKAEHPAKSEHPDAAVIVK